MAFRQGMIVGSLKHCVYWKSVLEPSNSHTYQMDDDQVWSSSIIRETVDGMKSNCHGKLANRPGQQTMMMVKKYSTVNKIKAKYLMRNREAARKFIRQQKKKKKNSGTSLQICKDMTLYRSLRRLRIRLEDQRVTERVIGSLERRRARGEDRGENWFYGFETRGVEGVFEPVDFDITWDHAYHRWIIDPPLDVTVPAKRTPWPDAPPELPSGEKLVTVQEHTEKRPPKTRSRKRSSRGKRKHIPKNLDDRHTTRLPVEN
ncbi:hypothetical protein BC332_29631 [Capsicum chinense]|nr:hypothetical protein BC332_29631 [Capsicum chinense]